MTPSSDRVFHNVKEAPADRRLFRFILPDESRYGRGLAVRPEGSAAGAGGGAGVRAVLVPLEPPDPASRVVPADEPPSRV